MRLPGPGSEGQAGERRESSPPAYVLGGHEAGVAVVRSLGRRGVRVIAVVISPAEQASASRYASASVIAPDPDRHERGFVALLAGLADELGGGVLIPTTDESVGAVASNTQELGRRHLLACPPIGVARRFLDKQLTYDLAAELDVPAPRSITPETEDALARLVPELAFPCLVKPRESFRYRRAFGVKMKAVHDAAELRAAWREAREAEIETMVQELIPGPESGGVNYNALFVDGEPVAELTARKLRLSPRDFGYPTAVVSASVPEVLQPAREILRGLGLNGFANVEFKRDSRDGRYKLMEVNGRPNMSGWLSVRCGIDFPYLTYSHLVDAALPPLAAPSRGICWVNELSDPLSVALRWRRGDISAREGLAPYVSRHVFATFALRDPRPFLKVVPERAQRLLRRIWLARSQEGDGRGD